MISQKALRTGSSLRPWSHPVELFPLAAWFLNNLWLRTLLLLHTINTAESHSIPTELTQPANVQIKYKIGKHPAF
nr:hypothetical protein [Pedobacter suwonensis]